MFPVLMYIHTACLLLIGKIITDEGSVFFNIYSILNNLYDELRRIYTTCSS